MKSHRIGRLDRSPLPFLAARKIERLIRDGKFMPGQSLPSENELANILGVSRSSLREALRILEEEGTIVKRHGIGTFVTSRVPLARNPLEIDFGVTEIIESTGMNAGLAKIEVNREKASIPISGKLKVDNGSSVSVIKRVRTADDRPVVYSLDYIPEAALGKVNIPLTFSGSLYEFFEEKLDQKVDHGIAQVIPALASGEISRDLDIAHNSPILLVDQVDYSIRNVPILYSQEYWRSDVFAFTIFRRRR
ncbi:GntR family transcriptional regulator [Chloroflexota bacterium]